MQVYLHAFRVHHWAKNLLVFVPLATALQITDPALLGQGVLAFIAFSLCASATYVVNDLRDLAADRQHATKRHRPFASGALSARTGGFAAAVGFGLGGAIAVAFLPPAFGVSLGLYVAVSLAYSLGLKRVAVLDVLVLTGFYVLRLFAGGAATATPPSPWLLAFSTFFFLSLAFVKRYAELLALPPAPANPAGRVPGRGYRAADRDLLRTLGPTSGYLSVLVLALYLNSEQVTTLYARPEVLWLMLPLFLYWITRIWLLAHRGMPVEDPVVFALRDPVSYAVAFGVAALVLAGAM